MLSGHVEGAFLRMLVAITGARRVLEIGMFTGYSALAMAEAMPPDGHLVACEVDDRAAAIAREGFAGVARRRLSSTSALGPAHATLRALGVDGEPFDLVFIDADKAGYADYLDLLLDLDLLAPGAVVVRRQHPAAGRALGLVVARRPTGPPSPPSTTGSPPTPARAGAPATARRRDADPPGVVSRVLRAARTDRRDRPPRGDPPDQPRCWPVQRCCGVARAPAEPQGERRTVLVSGGKMTKALVLARLFHAAGHRVVMVETARYRLTGHRFSRAVDAFHVVPDPDLAGLRRRAAAHRQGGGRRRVGAGVQPGVEPARGTGRRAARRPLRGAPPRHRDPAPGRRQARIRRDGRGGRAADASDAPDHRSPAGAGLRLRRPPRAVGAQEHPLRPGPPPRPDSAAAPDPAPDGRVRARPADLAGAALDPPGAARRAPSGAPTAPPATAGSRSGPAAGPRRGS